MLLIIVSLSVVLLDQLSKFIVAYSLGAGQSIPVIKNLFHITLVNNTGAAFGVLKNRTLLFIVISMAAIFLAAFYLPKLDKKDLLSRASLALILGGAMGNLIDRLRLGYVIDFLDFRVWPVFNIADSALTIGAILLVIELLCKKTNHASDTI